MPRGGNWYHADLMESYYLAREAWEAEAEAVTLGYDTEMAEYKATNPPPRFRDWLIHNSREREMA